MFLCVFCLVQGRLWSGFSVWMGVCIFVQFNVMKGRGGIAEYDRK